MVSKKRKSGIDEPAAAKKTKLNGSAPADKVTKNAESTSIDAPTDAQSASAVSGKVKRAAVSTLPAPAPASDDFADFDSASENDTKPAVSSAVESALLAGFDSSSSDSEIDPAPITKIPRIPSSALAAAAATTTTPSDPERTPGTIVISRIPHGFYEPQLRSYLSQFGTITRLRLSRNKKTGKAKHYGFVEFASAAVADIVVKTMDKYLLFGHILQVRRVRDEEVHPELWKGAGRRFKAMPRAKLEGTALERGRGREAWKRKIRGEVRNRRKKGKALEEMGYEFVMPEIRRVGSVPKKVEEIVVGEVDGDVPAVDTVKESEGEKPAVVEEVTVEVEEAGDGTASKRKKGRKEKKVTKKARVSV